MFRAAFALWILFASPLLAQSGKPATVSEVSTYMGADREQTLYAAVAREISQR